MKTKQKIKRSDEREKIRAEAAAWFAKLQGPGRTPAALAAFKEWLAQSSEHERAFDLLTDMWEVLPSAVIVDSDGSRAVRRTGRNLAFRTFSAALAACVALVFVHFAAPSEKITYSTAVGEQRSVVLPDGSYVALNTDTTLVVAFRAGKREVALEKGEAAFEVAKDKSRPFVVSVFGERVTALGTKFNIRQNSSTALSMPQTQVAVTLIEGRVEVARPASTFGLNTAPHHVRVLEPGERATINVPIGTSDRTGGGTSLVVDRPNMRSLLAWERGEIMFNDVSLAAAAAEFNRYGGSRIVLGDPALEQLNVSGVFNLHDTNAAIGLIAQSHGLRVVNGFDNSIILQR